MYPIAAPIINEYRYPCMLGKNIAAGISMIRAPAADASAVVRGMVLGSARFPAILPTRVPPGRKMWVAQIIGGPSTCLGVFSAMGPPIHYIGSFGTWGKEKLLLNGGGVDGIFGWGFVLYSM